MNTLKALILFLSLSSIMLSAQALDNLKIDSIGLNNILYEYDNFKKLKIGLMYDTLSDKAGAKSNVVVMGHRYTDKYGPKVNTLTDINKIKIGDIFTVTKNGGEVINYKVFDNFIVGPYDDWVTYDHNIEEEILTLYSCSPMWDNSFRYIIKAVRINSASSTLNGSPDTTLRNYEMQASQKRAIFNPVTGVEPIELFVKKDESFDIVEANKKKYKTKIYKYNEVGQYIIKGNNGKTLKVTVE